MAQEDVLIKFEVDYSQLDAAIATLEKTGKLDPAVAKSFQNTQSAIIDTASDTQGLIKQFKEVAQSSIKMGKTVENAFGQGIQDALDDAGVSAKEFGDALKKADKPAQSLKKELLALKEAIARMKAEGKDSGKTFDDLTKRAGKLSDAIADTNAEIKNAGSDTRGLDNVLGSITALAGGYSAVQGAAVLFGDESEDLQKTLVKVNGAMALAQGLQVVYNATLKEGALTKLADSVVTGTQSAAITLYTFVTNGATIATKALRAAFVATGIGAIIILLISLVTEMSNYGDETKAAKEAQDQLRNSIDLMNNSIDVQIDRLRRLSNERVAQLKSQGADDKKITAERIKLINDEIKALEQKEANLRKLANMEKVGSEEAQRLYKEANDLFYQQEALKSQIRIIGFEEETKANEARKKAADEFNKKRLDNIEKSRQKELAAIKETVAANLKADADREDQLRIGFDNQAEITEEGRAKIEAINAKWDKLRKEMQESMVKSSEDAAKKIADDEIKHREEIVKTISLIVESGSRLLSLFSTISTLQNERDAQLIASRRKQVEDELKAGVITQKAAEARQRQIDTAERAAKRRQAQREKSAAVFSALLEVPKAFLQGLSQGGIYLAVIYAALAGVQAALIASRPIPKFFRGKKDRYQGPGMVADMGSELVERDGRMFLYTKPTQTYLGEKDKVYTAHETKRMLHNTNIATIPARERQERFDYDRLAKAIPSDSITVNIDKDFISESVASGLSKNNYYDRRYSSR